jgi:hypothetical protein
MHHHREKSACYVMLQRALDLQAFVNTVMNLQVPYKIGNFLTGRLTISFLRRS